MSEILIALAVAAALVEGNSPPVIDEMQDPVVRLVSALEQGQPVPVEIFRPALRQDQLARFERLSGCNWSASFASTTHDRILSWLCPDGRRHSMRATVVYGQIEDVVIDDATVWIAGTGYNG